MTLGVKKGIEGGHEEIECKFNGAWYSKRLENNAEIGG